MPFNRPWLFVTVLLLGASPSLASEFFVRPDGSDLWEGTATRPLRTIQAGLDRALPGDIVQLMPGRFEQDVATVRDGTGDKPITIRGTTEAIVVGAGATRIFQIGNDYIHLEGFLIDGHFRPDLDAKESYRDKLVYVMAREPSGAVTGFKMSGMFLQNAGSECVRLRYGTNESEISNNYIRQCGNWDFRFLDGGKNGEGIYVGTAPEQLGKFEAPTSDIDHSNENWIHHNFIDTHGNECVDLKEGSTGNVVEFNTCTGQTDTESGGIDSRGNGNIIRFNEIFGNIGVGVRLGGDAEDDGIQNEVYGNLLRENIGGGIRVQREPQRIVCDNQFVGNGNRPMTGTFGRLYGGGGACDPTLVTDTASVTGSAPTSTVSTAPGAGPFPPWPEPQAAKVAAAADTQVKVRRPLVEAPPAAPTDQISQASPAGGAYTTLTCPLKRANCIIGEFRPGEGLLVLQATDATLVGATVGFADVLVDTHNAMINPGDLAGGVVGIEFDRLASGGLVSPMIVFVVDVRR